MVIKKLGPPLVCKVQNLVDVTGILALKILGFEQVRTEVTSVEL